MIVLGAAVWQNGPSPALLERLAITEDLFHKGYAPAIITTGGAGTLNPTPEGTAARLTLIASGIPRDVVYEEVKSRNTRENLEGAREIMQKHDNYQLLRAVNEARRVGIDASGCGVQKTTIFRPPLVLREVCSSYQQINK
ncbi:ElyC/SanA/YdcF family protein [Neomoorella humiferrea]|uniref:ElyC/SanA/YdcF family protein n=1 Tax=Neomoorella humiferrea TaxID=676965 RepID=UPI000D0345AF